MANEFHFLDGAKLKIPTTKELAEADNGTRVICLMTGVTEGGEKGWVFIAIRPSLYELFNFKCKRGEEILTEAFGEIIAHGDGLPPPAEMVKQMEKKYGFDPHFSERLVEEAKKQQKAFFMGKETLRIQNIVATLKKAKKDPDSF